MSVCGPSYRLFISSPGDVAAERERALRVVSRLNGEFEGILCLIPIAWERKTYSARADFQAQIEAASDCDLVAGILWNRVGSPLDAARYTRPEDGTAYESGTVFEIETALNRCRQGLPPDVVLFRKHAPPNHALTPMEAEDLAKQLALLESITRRWLFTESGAFKAAFNPFRSPDEFETLFEQHLRAWLAERGHSSDGVTWRIHSEDDTPYPGLAPYDMDRAAVFFGRDQARSLGPRRLVEAAARGCAFLLINGASGAGKSSLARAGLLPRLAKPGVAPGVDDWRIASFTPGRAPLTALAEALFAALPELAAGDAPAPFAWAAMVQGHPPAAAGSVVAALQRAGAAKNERLCLLVLADQLEEVFAAPQTEQAAFCAALEALARFGMAWVIATLRADRYAGLLEQPALVALKRDGLSYDLTAPGGEDIEAIIRGPAQAAGLSFETGADGRDLAAVLRQDVGGADALPLLQMTLAKLFANRDRATGMMTFASYQALGGLQGAIEARAEEVFAPLIDTPAATALPALLLALVNGVSEEGRILAREAPATELEALAGGSALLQAMVEGRLLLTESREQADGKRQVWVRVAHEALLRNWQRAGRILAPEPLRAKPRVEQAEQEWRQRGQRRRDLLRGARLDGAMVLLRAHGNALPVPLRDFVKRSQRTDRLARYGTLTASIVIAASFGALGLVAEHNHRRAEHDFRLARDAVEGLVNDLARSLRNVVGIPLEVIEKTLSRAEHVVDRLVAAGEQDEELTAVQAAMLNTFASTYASAGDAANQLRSAERSLALLPAQGYHSRWDALRAEALAERGDGLRMQARLDEALAAYQQAAIIRETLAGKSRDTTAWLAYALAEDRIGDVLRTARRFDNATSHYTKAEAVRLRLLAETPDDDRIQRDLSWGHNRIGDALFAQADHHVPLTATGDPIEDQASIQRATVNAALSRYRSALAIRERLAQAAPLDTGSQRDLAWSLNVTGSALLALNQPKEALVLQRRAQTILEALLQRNERDTVLQRDLAISLVRRYEALAASGQADAARESLSASLGIRQRLASLDQDNPRWQRDLFYAEAAMSRLLDGQGQQAAASAHRVAAAAAGRKAMEAFPADTTLRQELAQLD